MQKIIIRTPNFLGDTINTTPCIQLIRQEYPNAQIVIVCPDSVKDVFKYNEGITRCITFPLSKKNSFSTYWQQIKGIRKEKGDLGIIFVNTFISALIFKLAGIKCNIGYKNESRGWLLDFKPKLNRNKHYINRYASLFNDFINKKYTILPELYLPVSGEQTFSFDNDQKTIGLYLGGEDKGCRRYPDEYSVLLIQMLNGKGYNVVLIGNRNDDLKQAKYQEQANVSNILNLSGKTDVEGLFNTIARLDLLITIDSAALHIAAAVETPFVALMGLSTSPTSTITPKVSFGKILKIENALICEEDYMQNITPEIVLKNITELLSSR